jgi:hypothetical protein
MEPSPSARSRPGGGLAHAFHDRSPRRIHTLLDAVARTADQRECKGHDCQDAQLLISRPATIQARPAVDGKGDGLWSATDAIEIPNERLEHPKISDPKQIAILEKRCPPKPGCKGTRMSMTGVGC